MELVNEKENTMSGTVPNEKLCLGIPSFEERLTNALRDEFHKQFSELTERHIKEAQEKLINELRKEAERVITNFVLHFARGINVDSFKDTLRIEIRFPIKEDK